MASHYDQGFHRWWAVYFQLLSLQRMSCLPQLAQHFILSLASGLRTNRFKLGRNYYLELEITVVLVLKCKLTESSRCHEWAMILLKKKKKNWAPLQNYTSWEVSQHWLVFPFPEVHDIKSQLQMFSSCFQIVSQEASVFSLARFRGVWRNHFLIFSGF